MYGYVYKTTNLVNGKVYVGMHKGIFNPAYLGSGALIKRAIKKYGRLNFNLEVLAPAYDQLELDTLEKRFIAENRMLHGKDLVYNICDGGEGAGHPQTEETKAKLRAAFTGPKNVLFGKKVPRIQIEKQLATKKAKGLFKRSLEAIEKQRRTMAGRIRSPEHCANLSLAQMYKPKSKKHVEKLKEAWIIRSKRDKQQLRESMAHALECRKRKCSIRRMIKVLDRMLQREAYHG